MKSLRNSKRPPSRQRASTSATICNECFETQAHLLEEGLFILAEEYGDWVEFGRRIDLLGLDADGRLVVVELKREDQDSLMDLQAVRYAAMVANTTLEQSIDAHQGYMDIRGIQGEAESRIGDHLGAYEDQISISTCNLRIILVSANFSTELTNSVLWLNNVGLDNTCVKLQLYSVDDSVFVERTQVLPMPEAEDYMVRLRGREREAESRRLVQILGGGDDFAESISGAREEYVEKLQSLHQFALSLEKEGIISLSTSLGKSRAFLRVRFPEMDIGLVNIADNSGYGYPQFNGRQFDRYAPAAKRRVEEVTGDDINPGTTYWGDMLDYFIEAVANGYCEACDSLWSGDYKTAEVSASCLTVLDTQ